MGLGAASPIEVVFRHVGVELRVRHVLLAANELDPRQVGCDGDCPTHAAIRTRAAPDRVGLVGKPHLELHRATMTGRLVHLRVFHRLSPSPHTGAAPN